MKKIDDRISTVPYGQMKFFPEKVLLLREPIQSAVQSQNFRFAILDKTKKNAFFLHDKKVFSLEEIAKVLPRQEMFVCEFCENNLHNTVQSQTLSDFCRCDEVGDREILYRGKENKALESRIKKFENMHNSLKSINPMEPISVEELLRYERLLVCVQERGIKEEKSQTEIFDFVKQ